MKTHLKTSLENLRCSLCESKEIKPYQNLVRQYAHVVYHLELGQCTHCGFVFLQNDPHIVYDLDYLHQENVISASSRLAHFRAKERMASIARKVPPQPTRRFLDVGIGDGLLLSLAEQAGYTAFGLDINPDGVVLARKQYGLQAEVQIGVPEYSYSGKTFDVIHMNEVIEHIAEPMLLLSWCYEHLAKGGYLVVQTGNIDSVVSRIKGARWDYFRPVHMSYFSTRTLSAAMRRVGFQVVRRSSVDWRLGPSVQAAFDVFRLNGWGAALNFLLLYATALPYGVRRTMILWGQKF